MSHTPPQPATTPWQSEQLFSLIALPLTFYFNRRGRWGERGRRRTKKTNQFKTKRNLITVSYINTRSLFKVTTGLRSVIFNGSLVIIRALKPPGLAILEEEDERTGSSISKAAVCAMPNNKRRFRWRVMHVFSTKPPSGPPNPATRVTLPVRMRSKRTLLHYRSCSSYARWQTRLFEDYNLQKQNKNECAISISKKQRQ